MADRIKDGTIRQCRVLGLILSCPLKCLDFILRQRVYFDRIFDLDHSLEEILQGRGGGKIK